MVTALVPPDRAPAGPPLRVAFVGQRTFFEACALDGAHDGLHGTFLEFRAGADVEPLLARLAELRPDVTVAFRPEIVPPGAFAGLPGAVLGFLTEPLPRSPEQTNRDLEGRRAELRRADPANFDRLVAFDPLVAELAADALDVWRSVPLPVADRLFAPAVPEPHAPARALFVGRSTPHRERMLTPAKHRFDLLHVAFGVDVDRLAGLLAEHDVAVNLHTDAFPSFENRVALHLAAGHLVLSEPLEPRHGLEPGADYLEVRSPDDVVAALELLERDPGAWRGVRMRGRQSAERFRASRVYRRLLDDLRADLAAFGSPRTGAG